MKEYSDEEHINVGTGKEISIKNLAKSVKDVVGYEGEIRWDTDYPNGTPRKLLDTTKINDLGWKPETSLREGIEMSYQDFRKNHTNI